MDHIKMKMTTHFYFLQVDRNENENEFKNELRATG